MNQITIDDNNETVLDEDACVFYILISVCIGKPLEPSKDKIVINKPPWTNTRNGQVENGQYRSLIGRINGERCVALKRCANNEEYVRREVAIEKARRVVGFSSYNVIKKDGLVLRNPPTGTNCTLLKGWEQVSLLIIDLGNYEKSRTFSNTNQVPQLKLDDIQNIQKFCYDYGMWAAFNILFGVRDRNEGNFVFFTDTQILYSIDNEDGPFDAGGHDAGIGGIVDTTITHIKKFIPPESMQKYLSHLRNGFVDGWKMIENSFSKLDMFKQDEIERTRKLLEADPVAIATSMFS